MFAYVLLLIFVLICVVGMIAYIILKTRDIIRNKIKNKILCWILSLLPILLLYVGFRIDGVNAIVVDMHLFIFMLLSELVIYIIKKTKKINIKSYISIICGISISFVYLGIAYYLAHHVVETDYILYTEKEIGTDNFRVAQISDSHVGATMNGNDFARYMEKVNESNPDIVVITGDFVDDDTTYDDMIKSCAALGNLKTKYGVYFVYGNHDKGYYSYRKFDDSKLRSELEKNNVIIIEDDYVNITDNIVLVGRQDAQVQDRVSAIDLTKNIDKNKYIIMLDHEPNDFDNEVLSESDLVLLGHTHGGQLLPLGQIGLLLKENDKIYGMETRKKTTFIVNSGIGDWAIKFKSGTKAEYVIIDIKNK